MTGTTSTVRIVEVGLRDGLQMLDKPVPVTYKLELIERLLEAGVGEIQVTSFVHPRWVPQMADAETLCARLPAREDVLYSGLVLNLKGVERALATGIPAVDMSVAATETFSRRNLNCSVAEALARMGDMAHMAAAAGLRVRAGIQVAFGCPYEGAVSQERVLELVRQIVDLPLDELSLSDSAGMANPLQLERVLSAVRPLAGDLPIVLHLHDTQGMGLANVYAGLRQGVTRFDTAFGGLGGCPFIPGAKGNIATETTVAMLEAMECETGIDPSQVRAIAADFANFYETLVES